MTNKKPTLGRGLADLLGQGASRPSARPAPANGAASSGNGGAGHHPAGPVGPGAAATGVPADGTEDRAGHAGSSPPHEELAKLPLDVLQRGRYQPRIDMRPETLQELADSIKVQGVVQPIVVRPIETRDPGDASGGNTRPASGATARYEIIAGERRWRAAQLAGLTHIPAVIRRIPDEAAIAVALIENIQRENLNPLEEARALERLIKEFELTHQQAAEAVGRSRAGVSNLLRLLELAPEVAERLERREIEMGHARALLALVAQRQQVEVAALVVKKSLSVRDTEALVRRMQQPPSSDGEPGGSDPNVDRLEQELTEKLGARVAIQHSTAGKGRLVVSYNSLDELDGILAHIH